MKKSVIGKKELESGKKRIYITIDIPDFDDLILCAEYQNVPYTTLAGSWVVQKARLEAEKIRGKGYVPKVQRGENLFSSASIKTEGVKLRKGDFGV